MKKDQRQVKNRTRVLERMQRRFERARPGTVLIFVVVLLVLLALMGTAFMAATRTQRISAGQHIIEEQGTSSLQSCVDQVLTQAEGAVAAIPLMNPAANPASAGSPFLALYDGATTPSCYGVGTNGLPVGAFLADRYPQLLPDSPSGSGGGFGCATALNLPPVYGAGPTPAWRAITRLSATLAESPWNGAANAGAPDTYDPTNPLVYYAPTSVAITYPPSFAFQGATVWCNPALVGRTRVFPAFDRWTWQPASGSNPGQWVKDASGPYLAADAMGGGIGDSALVPLASSTVGGDNIYYGVRIVDNAAAFNANTLYSVPGYRANPPTIADPDSSGNNNLFFPSDLTALTLTTTSGANPQVNALNLGSLAHQYSISNLSAYNEAGGQRTDYSFFNAADAFWHGVGSRPSHPGYLQGLLCGNAGARAYDTPDTAAFAYRGGMICGFGSPSLLETSLTFECQNALNYVTYSGNQFKFVPANAVGYWYDWNYNWENLSIPGGGLPLAQTTVEPSIGSPPVAVPYRTLRPMFVANNPVVPKSTMLSLNPQRLQPCILTPPNPATGYPTYMSSALVPVRTSLNTPRTAPSALQAMNQAPPADQFPDLWRSFWSAMATPPDMTATVVAPGGGGDPTGESSALDAYEAFHVAGDPPNALDSGTFRNTLRDPTNTQQNGRILNTNKAAIRFDKYNVLLLRAAIAALNVEQFRYCTINNGVSDLAVDASTGAVQQIPGLCLARKITLRGYDTNSNAYHNYDVTIHGAAVQPFITEVYANTDNVTPAAAGGTTPANPKGYVAVELYNPYPFAISLKGCRLGVIDRRNLFSSPNPTTPLPTPGSRLSTIEITANLKAAAALDAMTIAARSTVVLENFDPTNSDPNGATVRPSEVGSPPNAKFVPDLHKVFQDSSTGVVGGELVVFRPHTDWGMRGGSTFHTAADGCYDEVRNGIADMVPCDSYDFTGLSLDTAGPKSGMAYALAWHYLRDRTADSWKWTYPGPYTTVPGFMGVGCPIPLPRQGGTQFQLWNPSQGLPGITDPVLAPPGPSNISKTNPGDPAPAPSACLGVANRAAPAVPYFVNPFPPIELLNVNFGGPGKGATGTSFMFPFGGFARAGDVLQVPFIGAYTVRAPLQSEAAWQDHNPALNPGDLVEINSPTMDCAFADDGDPTDDTVEHLGHFMPIDRSSLPAASATGTPVPAYDDYTTGGSYPAPAVQLPVGVSYQQLDATLPASAAGCWRYRWAMRVIDAFTTVNNPADDYAPNCDCGQEPNTCGASAANPTTPAWKNGIVSPANNAVQNTTTAGANGGAEDYVGVEGLININTANWRVLTALQMIPASVDPPGALNRRLAKLIVRYRDYDDGLPHADGLPHPHGPFQSLMELNRVFDPANPTNTFQNALGTIPGGVLKQWSPSRAWGNLIATAAPSGNPQVCGDFQAQMMMVNRISNMVTLRSDSFTAYIIVQKWRNVGTPYPELLDQMRKAVIIDRTAVPPGVNAGVSSLKTAAIVSD